MRTTQIRKNHPPSKQCVAGAAPPLPAGGEAIANTLILLTVYKGQVSFIEVEEISRSARS